MEKYFYQKSGNKRLYLILIAFLVFFAFLLLNNFFSPAIPMCIVGDSLYDVARPDGLPGKCALPGDTEGSLVIINV